MKFEVILKTRMDISFFTTELTVERSGLRRMPKEEHQSMRSGIEDHRTAPHQDKKKAISFQVKHRNQTKLERDEITVIGNDERESTYSRM